MANSRLHAVYELGQSIWYDNIRRGLITSGDLQRLIDDDAVVGITSNPTIFEKAIDGSTDYDEQLRSLVQQGVTDAGQAFEALAIKDIQMAADVLRPIFDRTNHIDGYISLEVSPGAANHTQETLAEARHLFATANRPNVFIKIPATPEGIPAIEQMIYEGVNINITLIFALDIHKQVIEAYLRGLERRQAEGKPVTGIASVASFFVSRVDSLVDKQLESLLGQTQDSAKQTEIRALLGQAAIANARLAYKQYQEYFEGERFAKLKGAGAQVQRCLWASTSTKNPAYRDVLYVEQLIAPETVDTMPPQTIVAFQEHGNVAQTIVAGIPEATVTMQRLAAVGIDMAAVTKQLEVEGVSLFADSFNKLIHSTGEKIARLAAEMSGQSHTQAPSLAGRQSASLGALQSAVDATLERADSEHFARQVWDKNPAFWKPNPSEQQEITNRLGWLTVTDQMKDALPRLRELRDDVRSAGFTHVVLLGMGGSSLAPEVLETTYGVASGQPKLHILDTTDPATILATTRAIDLAHALFIVASKSGGTIETLSQFRYFESLLREKGIASPGAHFIAITDPGTKLDQLAQEHNFRQIFRNPDDIGGRYSALSFFGLVPAAIIGLDVPQLLDRAELMQQACHPSVTARENPGLWLGAVLGTLALHGHDKVTLVAAPPIASFGYWVEQLIAESTGKEGKGILPVEGERLGAPDVYGGDRLFVYLRTEHGADPTQDDAVAALERAGQPVVRLSLADTYDLGQEFFRWEFAIAIAGALLGINAFDQPNVQESKDVTDALLRQEGQSGSLPEPVAALTTETGHVSLVGGERETELLAAANSLQSALVAFGDQAQAGDYVALLA
ncbi:MAG TPA: bifunctional transaldolase/phosoglucose isomerase, partial [Ktedonobacterales bacterium]|nr:bifunctional transaldolase/phosoglucose isomerase [Ktedonobacterales bacterium]